MSRRRNFWGTCPLAMYSVRDSALDREGALCADRCFGGAIFCAEK